MQNFWNSKVNSEFLATQGNALKYSVVKLRSWPDLSQVPEREQPLAARICALLSRKPSASRLVPLILSAPESDVYHVMVALVRMDHVVVATTIFSDAKTSATLELHTTTEPKSQTTKFGFVPKSLVAKLWQKFAS